MTSQSECNSPIEFENTILEKTILRSEDSLKREARTAFKEKFNFCSIIVTFKHKI